MQRNPTKEMTTDRAVAETIGRYQRLRIQEEQIV